MAYTLPNFNLLCDIYNPGHSPGNGDPPDFVGVPCQVYIPTRANPTLTAVLRLPNNIAGLTITTGTTPPVGSGTGFVITGYPNVFFTAGSASRVNHPGFPNEYWSTTLVSTDNHFNNTVTLNLPW